MSKRILLIDSDESFAQRLAAAANARGFEASTATNSEQGMTLARQESPDLIVVCVEAQPTNGYMLCTRLKKDERLRAIPVILTSANATPDSFEKHKKLKTRAEDYLIKPFGAQAMLQMASRLLGGPTPAGDEEIVSMDDESLGLGNGISGDDEPIQLGEAEAAEAHSANDDPVVELEELVEMDDAPAPVRGGGDEDLDMFDQAFDALQPSGGSGAVPVEKPRLRVAPDPEPEPQQRRREPTELSAPTDEQLLGLDEESALAGLEAVPPAPKTPSRPSRPPPPRAEPRARTGERSVAELRQELEDKAKQLADLQEQQGALEDQAQQLKEEAAKRDASAKALQQRADALAAAAKKFERELTAARVELKAGGGKSQAAQLEAELDKAREEVAALTGEKDLLREERDELRKQVSDAQAATKQNEERAIRAYQKMKGDEKLRERMRKALQIALALLEDGAVDTGSGSEPEKKKSA
ncbi:MAG TPA: response regulator [Myxococcales bacterium]|jgi:DNA-binding response OmpR family regulator|nr:response regulator [Myxococcales bacterium]